MEPFIMDNFGSNPKKPKNRKSRGFIFKMTDKVYGNPNECHFCGSKVKCKRIIEVDPIFIIKDRFYICNLCYMARKKKEEINKKRGKIKTNLSWDSR
jgi:ferredoxin